MRFHFVGLHCVINNVNQQFQKELKQEAQGP